MDRRLGRLLRKADAVALRADKLVSAALRAVRGEMSLLADELNLGGSADDRAKAEDAIRRRLASLSKRLDRLLAAQNRLAAKSAVRDASDLSGVEIRYSSSRAEAVCQLVTPAQGDSLAAVLTDRMAQSLVNALRSATVAALRENAIAGGPLRELGRDILERWQSAAAEKPVFTDSAGRTWDTARYVQMNARTNSMRVYNDCLADALARTGSDLVRVSRGGNPTCDGCFPWEGAILSLSGRTDGFPTYEQARASGCFHPNCTHTLDFVDETADADEIALQRAHPIGRHDSDGSFDFDAADERRYEIDVDRKMRDDPSLSREAAETAVNRDNLAANIRSGLVRADAADLVAALSDAQIAALCPDGNPPKFAPVKRVRGGTREKPKFEPERWRHGSRGGTVHVSRDTTAEHLAQITKLDETAAPESAAKPAKSADDSDAIIPLDVVRSMKIQDALKLKQIANIIPDAATRFDEAERLNNADENRLEELRARYDALFKLPYAERVAHFDEAKSIYLELVNRTKDFSLKKFERNVEAFEFGGENCTVKSGKISKARAELFSHTKTALEKLYAADVFPAKPINVKALKEDRSFHRSGTVFLSDKCPLPVSIHEASHFAEYGNEHIHKRCLEFLNYRTNGEKAESLRKLTGNRKYDPDEMARPDHFFKPYCGKDYGGKATEILSMGVEQLTRDPKKFYNTDPEYFNFCIGIIRGKL